MKSLLLPDVARRVPLVSLSFSILPDLPVGGGGAQGLQGPPPTDQEVRKRQRPGSGTGPPESGVSTSGG